ncbi:MAG TPA: DUF2232 domain-containing protein [bacterium]|nr:DUF2232 domain-containing protein [bacterium]
METLVALILQLAIMGFLFVMAAISVVLALVRGYQPRSVVLAGAGALGLLLCGILAIGREDPKENLAVSIQNYFTDAHFEKDWEANTKAALKMNVSAEKMAAFKDQYHKYFYDLLPSWLGAACLVYGLFAYYLVSFVLSRLTQRVPRAMPFKDWVIPEPLVFGLIGAGALKLIAGPSRELDLLAGNGLVLFGAIYVLSGFSIVAFLFNKWRLPATLRVLSYLILVQLPLETVGVLGVLDVWFDFRKIKSRKPEIMA